MSTQQKVDELKEILKATEVKELEDMKFTLADAIREGSSITEQAHGWGTGENACALHAAVISAKARGYME
jgi:phage gp29-like protein